jgi:hypothetical protein
MGGQGVAAVAGAVDDEHVEPRSGEQHPRGRAGGAGADDDGVVVVGRHGLSSRSVWSESGTSAVLPPRGRLPMFAGTVAYVSA